MAPFVFSTREHARRPIHSTEAVQGFCHRRTDGEGVKIGNRAELVRAWLEGGAFFARSMLRGY